MWDQFWQKLVQVQISIVVQSNHRTGALLCLNNPYLSFRRFNEWVAYVLDTISCVIQSTHTVTDATGFTGWFFPETFWKTICRLLPYSCLSCSSWITRMLSEERGCEGRRKATKTGVCLTPMFFPQSGCICVRLHPTLFAPAKEDIGSQVSPIFLLPLALQHCPYLLSTFSCHCYDISEPIFHVQQQEATFWQNAPICLPLHLALAGAFLHPNVLRGRGGHSPKENSCMSCLMLTSKSTTQLFSSWQLPFSVVWLPERKGEAPISREHPDRGGRPGLVLVGRRTLLTAGDASRTHQSEWNGGHWLRWGLDQIPVEKYACCELRTGKFHL